MNPALPFLGSLVLVAQPPVEGRAGKTQPPAVARTAEEKSQPALVGPTSAKVILGHSDAFRERLERTQLPAELKGRWKALKTPLTLVTVFGTWCSDSKRELPELMALEAVGNAFVEVRYLGVARDKQAPAEYWPAGIPSQPVERVPTFFLFALQPGGKQKLVGAVVEVPPKKDQRMAEALVELAETAERS